MIYMEGHYVDSGYKNSMNFVTMICLKDHTDRSYRACSTQTVVLLLFLLAHNLQVSRPSILQFAYPVTACLSIFNAPSFNTIYICERVAVSPNKYHTTVPASKNDNEMIAHIYSHRISVVDGLTRVYNYGETLVSGYV